MSDYFHSELTAAEALYAHAMGRKVLEWAKVYNPNKLALRAEIEAVALIEEIQSILNDETLDDSSCFYRIDAIVSAFHRAGLSTSRHWEVE